MDRESSGLSASDAQAAICKGTYGRKEWTATEKQAACEKYEQLTGTRLESGHKHTELLILPFLGIILVIGVAIIIYQLKTRKKTKKHH